MCGNTNQIHGRNAAAAADDGGRRARLEALLLALARLQLPPKVPPVRVERAPLPARVGPVLPQRRHVRLQW